MRKRVPALSRGMLILGSAMILAGLGWGVWLRLNAPPPAVITTAGAVVLAVTAPLEPTSPPTIPPLTPGPTITPPPTRWPAIKGPTPEFLPEWPTIKPATAAPSATPPSPLPSPTPTATPPPPAQKPPTRIVAPAIGLDARVVPMGWELVDHQGTFISDWVVPAKAAGWHMNSALPGNGGNIVLSGHHNVEGKVFRHIVDLEPGDRVILYVDDTPYPYIVTEKYILQETGMPLSVRKKNAQWIMPTEEERLTLVTCWPYEWPGNTHRVIVVARPLNYTAPLLEKIQK